ncbi:bone morphogenetic protein 10-like [Ylistrum balloti]|uniref:bone morphogenetic protein 10-like n=1 Tax=Ylistrum balloti TaxID=509963 RepID=UPI002905B194|nr:bone morphogenetic protein 10-like [Ylistrum balloti]
MKANLVIPPFILVHILLLKAVECRSLLSVDPPREQLTRTRRDDVDDDYEDYAESTSIDLMSATLSADEMRQYILPASLPMSPESEESIQLTDQSNHAPEYMMELYKQYSSKRLASPESSIVRSFTNINQGEGKLPLFPPICTSATLTAQQSRVHTMIFNITSISLEEVVDLAELRLFTLVEKDRNAYIGVDRKVSVFEVIPANDQPYKLVNSKHIYGRNSNWETFDVTSAVKRWVNDVTSVQILEIRIENVFHSVSFGELDIDARPKTRTEPLLVVFSSEYSKRRLHMKERHEMVTHEMDSFDLMGDLNGTQANQSESNTLQQRFKRKANKKGTVCRRRPLYIQFSDIGWDRWIIAPQGYQAYQCAGKCFFPFSDYLSPTKHSIIQTLLNSKNPKKASRACCVPTKLDSISILYVDEMGVVTFKYTYDGMVVKECGCR